MSRSNIKAKDLLRLTAYLDDALSEKERTHFESRLASSSELQQALQDHKRLKIALRALPAHKAPRNFTLKPEMLPVRKTISPLFPAFRLAAVVAAILLAVIFTGNRLLNLSPATPMMASMSEDAAMQEESMGKTIEEQPQIITWGAQSPIQGMGGGGGGVYGIGGGAETAPLKAEPQNAEPDMVMEEPVPAQGLDEDRSYESITAHEEAEPLILGINLEQAGEVLDPQTSSHAESALPTRSPIQWVQTGLGVLTLVLLAVALWLRFKR